VNVFSIPVRVYYEDTDAGGVVYYANYLRFFERARTEWLRDLGFEQNELAREESVVFAVRTANMDFIKAARFNDLLRVSVEVMETGKASIKFEQNITRGKELICRGEVRLACVDAGDFRPRAIPAKVVASIKTN
jgi:acyl-CoA thioester hydrolase